MEEAKKMMDKEKVKEMLDHQVRELSMKRTIESKVNPEELSYEFISSMFRPKEQAYNKEVYKQELRKQAEEQRMRKQMENHMNEEEYRINMNQLNVSLKLFRKLWQDHTPKITTSTGPWEPSAITRSSSSTTCSTTSRTRTQTSSRSACNR